MRTDGRTDKHDEANSLFFFFAILRTRLNTRFGRVGVGVVYKRI